MAFNVDDVGAVAQSVEFIRDIAGDDEVAHSNEDDLHVAVLRAIANGHHDPAGLAEGALKTLDIDFQRWCA